MTEATGSTVLADPWGARVRDWAEVEDENSRPLFETLHEAAGVGRGTRLLDVGCGSGLACALAVARGALATGIDASPGMAAAARERVPEADIHAGDMEALPFADDAFDVVTFANTLFFARDRVEALREAARVTCAGGTVAAVMWSEPERMELAAYVAAMQPLMPPGGPQLDPFVTRTELETDARRAGLDPERTFDVDWSWDYPDRDAMLRGLLSAGLSALAIENAGEGAVRDAVVAAMEPFRTAAGGYRIENTVRCLIATA